MSLFEIDKDSKQANSYCANCGRIAQIWQN